MKPRYLIVLFLTFLLQVTQSNSQPPKPVSGFKVCIGGKLKGKVSAVFFQENIFISPYDFKSSFRVQSFRLIIATKGRKQIKLECANGGALTMEMLSILRELPPGSRVYFENIVLRNKSGKTITARPLTFSIE